MNQKQLKRNFLKVLLVFAVSVISIVLIPFAVTEDGNLNPLGYVSGIMFWTGLLGGVAGYIILCKQAGLPDENGKKIPAIIRFFSNPPAIVGDTLLILGVAVTCLIQNRNENLIIQEILLLCIMAGFYTHILFNGKIYRSIWNYSSRKSHEGTWEDKRHEK